MATNCLKGEVSRITYIEHQDVRAAVMALMELLLSEYENEIFSQTCSCCGQCCINRTLLLNAKEIVKISRYLDISEARFRKRYILPASTWNAHDGTVSKKDKKCIFLEQGSSGTYKCAIYQVRPSSCREIITDPKRCNKDMGKLLTYVEWLEIESQSIAIHLTSGSCYVIEKGSSQLQNALNKLYEVVYPCMEIKHSQLDDISADVHRVLDWLLKKSSGRNISGDSFAQILGSKNDY